MATPAVTRDELGAWLVKAAPASASTYADRLTSRCVQPGYRAELMAPGDEILLWVSGDGRLMARGVWGVGRVTGAAVPESYDDAAGRPRVRLHVPVDLRLLTEAVPATDLLAAGVDDLEVQRLPVGANPSWVSRDQLARLRERVPGWPEPPDGAADEDGRFRQQG